MSGTWLYEREDPGKKSERDLYYAVKTIKSVGEEALPMLVQKREDNKEKRIRRNSKMTDSFDFILLQFNLASSCLLTADKKI